MIVQQNSAYPAQYFHMELGHSVMYCTGTQEAPVFIATVRFSGVQNGIKLFDVLCNETVDSVMRAGERFTALCGYAVPASHLGSVILEGTLDVAPETTKASGTDSVNQDTAVVSTVLAAAGLLAVFGGDGVAVISVAYLRRSCALHMGWQVY